MHAIEITKENLPKILATDLLSIAAGEGLTLFIRSSNRYYFVQGFVTERGQFQKWGVVTQNSLLNDFEYDADKIQHDWDQIVRIEQPE